MEDDAEIHLELDVGQTHSINLGTPLAGYVWQLDSDEGGLVVDLGLSASTSQSFGATATTNLELTPKYAGTFKVELSLSRPWEEKAQKHQMVKVVVNEPPK